MRKVEDENEVGGIVDDTPVSSGTESATPSTSLSFLDKAKLFVAHNPVVWVVALIVVLVVVFH